MDSRAETPRKMGRPLELALSAGQTQPDRLPGLIALLRQLAAELSDEMRAMLHRVPRVKLLDVTAATFMEFGQINPSSVCGVLWAEKWRQRLYCIMDASAALPFIEGALGSDEFHEAVPLGRPFSATEIRILETLFKRLSRALTNAFSIAVDVKCEVTHVVEKLDDETTCRPSTPIVAARLLLDWPGRSGIITVIIPQVAIEPFREALARGPALEAPIEPDESQLEWSRKLSDEIARAFTHLVAVVDERAIPLSAVRKFAVGTTIELGCTTLSTVRLDVEERRAFWCSLGKSGDDLCLRIERNFDPDEFAGDEI